MSVVSFRQGKVVIAPSTEGLSVELPHVIIETLAIVQLNVGDNLLRWSWSVQIGIYRLERLQRGPDYVPLAIAGGSNVVGGLSASATIPIPKAIRPGSARERTTFYFQVKGIDVDVTPNRWSITQLTIP